MLYQLPNGKVVYLSLEDYLSLTDEDVQYLVSTGYGDMPNNPFYGSAIKRRSRDIDDEEEDTSMDYIPDDEDTIQGDDIDINNIPDNDINFSDMG